MAMVFPLRGRSVQTLLPLLAAVVLSSTECASPPAPSSTKSSLPTASAGSISPAVTTGWIVYWSDTPWPSIWAVRPDGSAEHRILPSQQNAKRPRLSPDGKWVAFDGTPLGKATMSDFDIQLVGFDGRGLRKLTTSPDWDVDAQWSWDSQWLSFTRNPPSPTDCRESAIWLIRRDGSQARQIARGCGARWSPDGRTLIYVQQRDTFAMGVVHVDGSGDQTLLRTVDFEQPAGFSPDGKRILFTRSLDSNGQTGDIFVMNADGTGVQTLGHGFAACWSPDGSEILYTESFQSSLWAMKSDGSAKRRIASALAAEPDWR